MSLTYVIRENLNYGLNSTVYPGGNHSIDHIVDQVHDLAGEINEFSKTINKQVKTVGDRASEVSENFQSHFKNLSNEAHKIADVATYKFDDFPVNAFYAILILALIAIIVALCYFISVGGHLITQNRYNKTPTANNESAPETSRNSDV